MKRLTMLTLFVAVLGLALAGTACVAAEPGALTSPPQPLEHPNPPEPSSGEPEINPEAPEM